MPSIICTRLTTILPSSSTGGASAAGDDVVGPGHVVGRDDAVDRSAPRGHLRGLADLGLDEDVR